LAGTAGQDGGWEISKIRPILLEVCHNFAVFFGREFTLFDAGFTQNK
jgi:hypothetical protein